MVPRFAIPVKGCQYKREIPKPIHPTNLYLGDQMNPDKGSLSRDYSTGLLIPFFGVHVALNPKP